MNSYLLTLQRTTFDKSLDPEPYRPTRKVIRMQDIESLSAGMEGAYFDAGLAFGRSFRVSWGPGGMLAQIGGSSRLVICDRFYFVVRLTVVSSIVRVQSITMVADDEASLHTHRLILFHIPTLGD